MTLKQKIEIAARYFFSSILVCNHPANIELNGFSFPDTKCTHETKFHGCFVNFASDLSGVDIGTKFILVDEHVMNMEWNKIMWWNRQLARFQRINDHK